MPFMIADHFTSVTGLNDRPIKIAPSAQPLSNSCLHEVEPEAEDERLLVRVAAKDVAAFEQIYDRFCRPMFSLAVRVVGSRVEAEDILQDAFWQVWTHADRFHPSLGSAFHWICAIVRHKSIDRLRATRRHFSHMKVGTDSADLTDESSMGISPAHSLAIRDARTQAHASLKRLSISERSVIERAFFEGLTHQEIAVALHMPVGTVKAKIRRGLFKLRPVLSRKTAA